MSSIVELAAALFKLCDRQAKIGSVFAKTDVALPGALPEGTPKMCFPPQDCGSRREFFRGTLRYVLIGSLAVISAIVARARPRQKCVNQGICRDCAAFGRCMLPAALSAKQSR